jgi:hypothetical protein
MRLEQCIQADRHRADLEDAEERGDPLRHIGREDADELAHADVQRPERVADLIGLLGDLAKGHVARFTV